MSHDAPGRKICEGCGRPLLVCLCARLAVHAPRTPVVVLQHPREQDNPIGTAWMVERCLGAARIVGVELDDALDRALVGRPPGVLLSPGEAAIDLRLAPPEGPVTLVVVDGTWSQAKKLLRVNPRLAALPRYAFTPARPSQYRIRREPAEHCVSTIEATVAALGLLEGESPGLLRVLDAFERMVDLQVDIARERSESRHRKAALARAERQGPKPPPLSLEGLVVCEGEANAWPRGTEHGPFPEIVHFAAERVSTGERFEAFVAPERPLTRNFEAHTQLRATAVHAGEPRASFHARLRAFLSPGERLAAWGPFVTDVLAREGFALPPFVDLKMLAHRVLQRRVGDVHQTTLVLGEESACHESARHRSACHETAWAAGRTGRKLAAATAVARALATRVQARRRERAPA